MRPVRIPFSFVLNLYLIETRAGWVLVDCGAAGMFPWICRQLNKRGIPPHSLAAVVLTHAHADHAGTAAQFARIGVPVLAHIDDACFLRGEQPHPGYGGLAGRALHELEHRFARLRVGSVQDLADDQPLFGSPWQVVAAPGHTPGSIGLWHRDKGWLMSGDTLVTTFGRLRGPVPVFTADLSAGQKSALQLLDLEPKTILPGHGPPVAAARFGKLKAQLRGQVDCARQRTTRSVQVGTN